MGKGFELMHKHCQKAVPPSPQLPLPRTDAPMAIGTPQLCGECGARHRIGENTLCPGWRPERSPYAEFPDHRPMAGIDGSSDEPDPETDPPSPEVERYRMFDMNYPKPDTTLWLMNYLEEVLSPDDRRDLDWQIVQSWHPSSGQFDAVAHWARVENAHKTAGGRPPTPGMTIPASFPKPKPLFEALSKQPKAKMPRKKATTRKAAP
jgi:hypothetical protein